MRIAVIGAGVSGLLAARLLATRHEVMLFEASDYIGGHANTVDVELDGREFSVDTGFMVFNDRTYPNFQNLLKYLNLNSQASDMSFSVTCERTGWEYQGSSFSGLFSQKINMVRPTFWGMLTDILRFNSRAISALRDVNSQKSLQEFLNEGNYGSTFRERYLLPMTAAIWSSPHEAILNFSAQFLLRFMHNHGLLQLRNRPRWQTIPGGSRRYLLALANGMNGNIRLNCPVRRVLRTPNHVMVEFRDDRSEQFDAVVLATHADTSLKMLAEPSEEEEKILSAFPYQENRAVLHTDEKWLPSRRSAWASWNYLIPKDSESTCVTYDLTRLQRIDSPRRLLVTLNPPRPIDQNKCLREFVYHHPLFTIEGIDAQRRLPEINGVQKTYYCGAYWRNGFHEDGIVSALAVAREFGIGLESCTAACIAESSHIVEAAQ